MGAEYLLDCLLPDECRKNVIRRLKREYPAKRARYGPLRAGLWFWARALRHLWPQISSVGKTAARWGAALGGMRLVGEVAQRLGL